MNQVCETLKNQQDDLHKNSIYLLNTDDKDRDFEFFVLVDPQSQKERCDFLQELFQVLIENDKEFYNSDRKSDLQGWLGAKNENDRDLTPLNWLKVKIEQYPYRLFVVVNAKIWQKNGKTVFDAGFWQKAPAFLKKRICWIEKTDFQQQLKQVEKDLWRLRFWLMQKWLSHLCQNLLGLDLETSGDLVLYFSQLYESNGEIYQPATLPSCLVTGIGKEKAIEHSSDDEPTYRVNLHALGPESLLREIDLEEIGEKDRLLFFSWHRDFFKPKETQSRNGAATPKGDDYSAGPYEYLAPQLLYSESLSGSLSHFLRIMMALERDTDEGSQLFLLQLIEQSLLRLAIVDERMQEKYAQLENGRAAGIYQSRILVSYLGEPGRYGQKPRPADKPFGKIRISTFQAKSSGDYYTIPNISRFERLWPEQHRGLDIILIHQGILDKWKRDENYTRYMLALKDKVPFVIITSGRGIPSNLPQGIKFLPFSGLETCFVGNYFEKITLMRQIFNLV